jgi:adenylate cyclase
MAEAAVALPKFECGHVLAINVTGYSIFLSVDEQHKLLDELDEIVRSTVRFRVAEVAGKLICRPIDGGIALVFLSDPEAPIECAMEIARAQKSRPEIQVRMGIHSGPVNRTVDPSGEPNVVGPGIDLARWVMACGDAGHILLSKRTAYDLASIARWDAHLFELADCEAKPGEKISLVNFHTDGVGNPEMPTKLKRARQEKVALAKKRAALRWAGTAAVAILVLGLVGGLFLSRRRVRELAPTPIAAPEKSIAVLPFVDLSPARDQEYFCDSLSEEILDALAKVEGLRVVARTSAFSFQDRNADADEIGRKLGVSTILEGSLWRAGNQIRIGARLIDARSGSRIWSKRFEQDLADVFSVQDEIMGAVGTALKVQAPAVPRIHPGHDTVAYDLYLHGLFLSHKDQEEDLRASLDFFQRVLKEDPRLERAWIGVAKDWLRLAEEYVPPLDVYPQAQVAANKALTIDERDAEAHVFLGETKRIFGWDLKGEEIELQRALDLNPNSVETHLSLALLRSALGDSEQGLAEMRRAVGLDPLSPITGNREVSAYVANDRLDEAFAAAKRTMEIDPNYIYFEPNLALVYREEGKLHEALDIALRLQKRGRLPNTGLAITYARLGRYKEARKILEQLIQIAKARYFPAEQIASVYVALGEKEEAFRWLERAVDQRSIHIHEIAFAREFRLLRGDPKFAELLYRIGLDPTNFQARPSHQ